MKKLLASTLVLAVAATGIISGCSSKKEVKQSQNSNLPEWVIDPNSGITDGVAGVGIGSKSSGGIKFQIPKAEMDAKANIASAISSEISRVTKDALREAKVNDVNDVEQVFSQATKEVVKNMPMSGVKRINMWTDPADGTLYIRMILKNEDYGKYIQNSQKMYENRLKQANLGRENLDKSQEAVKGLFDELEKERGSDKPSTKSTEEAKQPINQ